MGKQWIKQEIRRNELQETVDSSLLWIAGNRPKALGAAGLFLLLVAGAAAGIYSYRSQRQAAWERLSMAQALGMTGRAEEAIKQLQELAAEQPGSDAASFGLLFLGDLQYRQGAFQEAVASYTKVLERGKPATALPMALANVAVAEEAGGRCREAADGARRFLETHPEHFLAPHVHASLARCLGVLKEGGEEKAAYQKIALQYPETGWAAWAQEKLKGP